MGWVYQVNYRKMVGLIVGIFLFYGVALAAAMTAKGILREGYFQWLGGWLYFITFLIGIGVILVFATHPGMRRIQDWIEEDRSPKPKIEPMLVAPKSYEDDLPDEIEEDLEWDRDEDEPESDPSTYILGKSDWKMVSAAKKMLWKAVRAPIVQPEQLVGLAKALYVVEQLPQVLEGICVSVTISSPKLCEEDREIRRFWEIRLEENEFDISSSGHHHDPSVGGDSFTVFSWNAFEGEETTTYDYRDQLWMIPNLADFSTEVDRIDFTEEGWTIDVTDESGEIVMDKPISDNNPSDG